MGIQHGCLCTVVEIRGALLDMDPPMQRSRDVACDVVCFALQLQLDQALTDITGVTLYPRTDLLSGLRSSMNISIYMSSIANYSADPNSVTCIEAFNYLIERNASFIPCAAALGVSVQYGTARACMHARVEACACCHQCVCLCRSNILPARLSEPSGEECRQGSSNQR